MCESAPGTDGGKKPQRPQAGAGATRLAYCCPVETPWPGPGVYIDLVADRYRIVAGFGGSEAQRRWLVDVKQPDFEHTRALAIAMATSEDPRHELCENRIAIETDLDTTMRPK